MRRPRADLAAASLFVALALPRTGAAQEQALQFIEIPVVINIHTANGSQVAFIADIDRAIEEANSILAQAGIRLNWVDYNVGDENPASDPTNPANAGNSDNDASMTQAERKAARSAGDKELDSNQDVGKDRGMKIYFTSVPDSSDPDEAGNSVHDRRTLIVRMVPDDDEEKSIKNTGETIAHEAAHALSLGPTHPVTDTATSDSGGHVPPTVSRNNLMTAAGFGNRNLTPLQIEEMKDNAKTWGSVQETNDFSVPVQPAPMLTGGGGDDILDHFGGPYLDIADAGIHSRSDVAIINLRLMVEGVIPDDQPLDLTYLWLFDTDANPGTGFPVAGAPGIERQVELRVLGDGITPPVLEAAVLDGAGALLTPLAAESSPEIEFEEEPPQEVNHRLEVDVDKALLGLDAPLVPVMVVSEGDGFAPADTFLTSFDTSPNPNSVVAFELSPAHGPMGILVQWQATALLDLTDATISLDGRAIQSGLVLPAGVPVSGSFPLCDLPVGRDFFFVTLQDQATRSFDFSVVFVKRPSDDFESYLQGSDVHGQGGWKGWDNNPSAGAAVTQDQALSGLQSIQVDGDADLVQEYCTGGAGQWAATAWQYVPEAFDSGSNLPTAGSWFILLNTYQDEGSYNWSLQVQVDSNDGLLHVHDGLLNLAGSVPFETDRWARIRAIIDLDDDWTRVYYDDALVSEYSWTGGVLGGGAGALDIAAVDLFANGSSSVYYDDIALERVGGCGDALGDDLDEDGLDRLAEYLAGTDSCDPDSDDDAALDGADNCPLLAGADQTDTDGDGIGDLCDPTPSCLGDIAQPLDGAVNVVDFLAVLAAWGGADPAADIAPPGGDGTVDILDFLAVLAAWGACS